MIQFLRHHFIFFLFSSSQWLISINLKINLCLFTTRLCFYFQWNVLWNVLWMFYLKIEYRDIFELTEDVNFAFGSYLLDLEVFPDFQLILFINFSFFLPVQFPSASKFVFAMRQKLCRNFHNLENKIFIEFFAPLQIGSKKRKGTFKMKTSHRIHEKAKASNEGWVQKRVAYLSKEHHRDEEPWMPAWNNLYNAKHLQMHLACIVIQPTRELLPPSRN